MGLYGSPDTGNLYTEEKPIEKKRKKGRPQTNILLWIVLIIFDLSFATTLGIHLSNILTALSLNILVIAVISALYLFYNVIKQNKGKLKDDIIWLLSSIIIFLIIVMIIGSI